VLYNLCIHVRETTSSFHSFSSSDLTSGMTLDQGAGTEGGPELLLSPPPTVQGFTVSEFFQP